VFLTEFTSPYRVVNITATVQNPQTCRLCERKTDISQYNTVEKPAASCITARLYKVFVIKGDSQFHKVQLSANYCNWMERVYVIILWMVCSRVFWEQDILIVNVCTLKLHNRLLNNFCNSLGPHL